MRTVLVAVAVLAAGGGRVASSKPARMDILERDEPIEPCSRGKTWKAVERCLSKQGTARVHYEAEGVKVVEVAFLTPATNTRISLYTQQSDHGWIRGGLYASASPYNALLGVSAFTSPLGVGVRVDLGQTMRTTISFNEGTKRGVVRRISSTICVPGGWQCRGVVTSCEAYVHGRLAWTFQGSVAWHPSLGLRLRGDTTRAGGMCAPPRTMLDTEGRD